MNRLRNAANVRKVIRPTASLLLLMASFLAGCGPPTYSDVKETVKRSMEEELHVQVTSITLQKEADNKFTGTAETQSGDRYDLTVTREYENVSWRAVPVQAAMEKQFANLIKEQLGSIVSSISLTKAADGSYSGIAKSDQGDLKLSTSWLGNQLILNAQR